VVIGSNYTLQVNMTDNGLPGTNDTLGIALWNGSTLLYSSNWIGGTTVQQSLGGGRLIVHHAQEVAGGALNGTASTQVLTQPMLQPIVTEAIARWQEAGAPPSAVDALRSTPVLIADLPDADVGRESANGVILIDTNAAGYGWYVDPTPADDSEFRTPSVGLASGHVDLLTVVAHEMGHVLGIAELTNPNDVMFQDLALGVRKMPTAADVAEAGLHVVAVPTFTAVRFALAPTVVDMSQIRRVNALGRLNHGIDFQNVQASDVVVNPGLLNAIQSLVTGSAEHKVLTNLPEPEDIKLESPLAPGTNHFAKLTVGQGHRIIGEPVGGQTLEIASVNFESFSLDDDFLNQLVLSRHR
jgi:hypothetical protein